MHRGLLLPSSLSSIFLCSLSARANTGSRWEAVAAEQLQLRRRKLQSPREAKPVFSFLFGDACNRTGGEGGKRCLPVLLSTSYNATDLVWVGNIIVFET